MSPATHDMSPMDPYKTDTNDLQQIISIRSVGNTKNCLRIAMLAVWAGSVPGCYGSVWDERMSK
jgi:hypothetical protein